MKRTLSLILILTMLLSLAALRQQGRRADRR